MITGAVWVVVACASNPERSRLPDGSYQLKCERKLTQCLESAEELCGRYGYDVLNASEIRDHYGPSNWESEAVKTSAVVRCRRAKALLYDDTPPLVSARGSAEPAPSAAPANSAVTTAVPASSAAPALSAEPASSSAPSSAPPPPSSAPPPSPDGW